MLRQHYQHCIEACNACAVTCSHCAISCLNEEEIGHLKRCIQLDLECAAICRSAAEVMSLRSNYSEELCKICAEICIACAEECEKHAVMGMEHCRECAEACRKCAEACEEMTHVI
ncbi:four-helix bundle copper-binding protein [Olivibacter domesticus]|uniref:four-helix bundle copper-binding protein n=1 Tax=Olivibacter domesticus TaxID=407022 RepID=UPI000B8579AC|nr:four-helix bundle copper-binding protein [Olivibacter domesticus]